MNEANQLSEALRTLPDPRPPEDLWDDITRRLEQAMQPVTRRSPRRAWRWALESHRWVLPVAVAASAAALGIWLLLAPAPERPTGFFDLDVAELLMESQSLEALVSSRPAGPNAIRNVLLIRIAEVDASLNDAWLADPGNHAMEPLLRRRVALLHSLVDLGQRPATRYNPALRPAVLSGDDR